MSPRPPLILAIDLGTSGPKVALATQDGRLVRTSRASTQLHLTVDGGAEQDPEDWWQAIVTATKGLWSDEHQPADVVAISPTAQWAGTVAVDSNGAPLHRAILWMDTRGAAYVPSVVSGLVGLQGYGASNLFRWVRKTGGIPSLGGKEPIAHIQWLRHERPDVFRRAHKFLEPKDWLVHRLSGRFVASFDSIALHWVTDNRQIEHIDYDKALLQMAKLDRQRLPALVRATDFVGPITPRAADELGVPRSAQVLAGTPDVHSAAVGSGAVTDFSAHLYLGTSSWLSCHVPYKKTDIFTNIASLPSALPGRYLVANSQETAGACVNWLRDSMLWPDDSIHPGAPPPDAFSRIDQLAATSAPGSDGVLFSPWLYGERCPAGVPHLRATFTNVSLRTRRAHLARAVLEGVALNTRWLLQAVERFAGRRLDPIRVIGGGARSELWCQIFADVLQRSIYQVDQPEHSNARGAAFLAGLASHTLALEQMADRAPIAARFHPRAEHRDTYDRLYRAFGALFHATGPIHHKLRAPDRD